MHVLLVEDEPEMAELSSRGLREESCAVSVAPDGRAALELSAAQSFDVILLDVMLPQLDSWRRLSPPSFSSAILDHPPENARTGCLSASSRQ
jgi:DNA-binding response OmpR family regulator